MAAIPMPLKKQQISIYCEHCRFEGRKPDDPHTIYVQVEIEDEREHRNTSVLLECRVGPLCHQVQLAEIDEGSGIDRDRLARTLETVAEKRLCGNSRICPEEIVCIVDEIRKEASSG